MRAAPADQPAAAAAPAALIRAEIRDLMRPARLRCTVPAAAA